MFNLSVILMLIKIMVVYIECHMVHCEVILETSLPPGSIKQ